MSSIINYNGNFISSDTPVFPVSSRVFRFGDGFFESMRFGGKHIFFFKDHLERLKHGMELLRMNLKDFPFSDLEKMACELCEKNNLTNARVRLQLFRESGGVYSPDKKGASYILEAEGLENDRYEINEKGLNIGIFRDVPKPLSLLSNIKSSNALVSVLASIYSNENQMDDSLLINADGNLVESSNSNVFVVINGKVITPPLKDGCVDGIMRRKIIELLRENKTPYEEASVSELNLGKADEVFLTNAIRGIRWVKMVETKSFGKKISEFLQKKLNGMKVR